MGTEGTRGRRKLCNCDYHSRPINCQSNIFQKNFKNDKTSTNECFEI